MLIVKRRGNGFLRVARRTLGRIRFPIIYEILTQPNVYTLPIVALGKFLNKNRRMNLN